MRTIFSSVCGDSNESPSTARTVLCSSLICTSIFNLLSNTDIDSGANHHRSWADKGDLVNSLVSDLDGFNRHVVLHGVQRGAGVFHRQSPPEIPDVVRRMQIGEQDDDSIATLAFSFREPVMPVP